MPHKKGNPSVDFNHSFNKLMNKQEDAESRKARALEKRERAAVYQRAYRARRRAEKHD